MAEEKKKLSTAEILAMARKGSAPGGGAAEGGAAEPKPPVPEAESPAESGSAEPAASAASSEATAPAAEKPAAPKAKPAATGGARPSVKDILAAARTQGAGAPPAAAKPAEKPAAAAPKAKPKPAAAQAAAEPPAPTPSGPKDTSSVLAAARKQTKPGPMSKSEAASRVAAAPAAKPAKAPIEVPPFPAKPDYAKPKPKQKAEAAAAEPARRDVLGFGLMFGSALAVGFTSVSATMGLWTLGLARFMFPNVLTEPPSRFKVGFPSDYPPGVVDEKFKAQFGVWIVNTEFAGQQQIVALKTVCTHLGCTPNWLDAEQKFKCPCHGSGFYKDGINFEGPAPRPLERYAIRLADDGQIEVDKSRIFQEEMGQWSDASSFIPV